MSHSNSRCVRASDDCSYRFGKPFVVMFFFLRVFGTITITRGSPRSAIFSSWESLSNQNCHAKIILFNIPTGMMGPTVFGSETLVGGFSNMIQTCFRTVVVRVFSKVVRSRISFQSRNRSNGTSSPLQHSTMNRWSIRHVVPYTPLLYLRLPVCSFVILNKRINGAESYHSIPFHSKPLIG
jgi:hypothetical protein